MDSWPRRSRIAASRLFSTSFQIAAKFARARLYVALVAMVPLREGSEVVQIYGTTMNLQGQACRVWRRYGCKGGRRGSATSGTKYA